MLRKGVEWRTYGESRYSRARGMYTYGPYELYFSETSDYVLVPSILTKASKRLGDIQCASGDLETPNCIT